MKALCIFEVRISLSVLSARNEVNPQGFRLDKPPFPQPIRPQGSLHWVPRSSRESGEHMEQSPMGSEAKLTQTKETCVPILPCRRFPNVRAEVKLQFPLKIEMSLLKMISPVINGAVCVLRIINLPPSTPHTGLWECPSKRVASRGGQYSLFGAPGTND